MRHEGAMRVMADVKATEHERRVKTFLQLWKDKDVLDVCCGYGRFAEGMNNYEGFDFSEEFVRQANHPHVYLGDAHEDIEGMWDVVFESISLSSLKMTPEQFYEKWKHKAREYVACFELDRFYIFSIYAGHNL
jgi:hypothetical protein